MQALPPLLLALALAAGASPATAASPSGSSHGAGDRTTAKTVVRILDSNMSVDDVTSTVVRGTVASPHGRCEDRRLVVVTMTGSSEKWRVRAQEFGRWHLRLPTVGHFPGQYTATAPRRRAGKLVCRRGSDTQYLNAPSILSP